MALVMFDYDGVIVDSLEVSMSSFTQACRENGFVKGEKVNDAISLFDGNVFASMRSYGLNELTIDNILKRYEVLQDKQFTKIKVFNGIREALQQISNKHYIYIITSNISSSSIKILRKNGINCIKDVVGAEKEKSKIKKIQTTMSLYPGITAYYIGDTKGDMIEGKNAGTQTIGVTWGWHSSNKLKEGFPDFLFDSPKILGDFFDNVD